MWQETNDDASDEYRYHFYKIQSDLNIIFWRNSIDESSGADGKDESPREKRSKVTTLNLTSTPPGKKCVLKISYVIGKKIESLSMSLSILLTLQTLFISIGCL